MLLWWSSLCCLFLGGLIAVLYFHLRDYWNITLSYVILALLEKDRSCNFAASFSRIFNYCPSLWRSSNMSLFYIPIIDILIEHVPTKYSCNLFLLLFKHRWCPTFDRFWHNISRSLLILLVHYDHALRLLVLHFLSHTYCIVFRKQFASNSLSICSFIVELMKGKHVTAFPVSLVFKKINSPLRLIFTHSCKICIKVGILMLLSLRSTVLILVTE